MEGHELAFPEMVDDALSFPLRSVRYVEHGAEYFGLKIDAVHRGEVDPVVFCGVVEHRHHAEVAPQSRLRRGAESLQPFAIVDIESVGSFDHANVVNARHGLTVPSEKSPATYRGLRDTPRGRILGRTN